MKILEEYVIILNILLFLLLLYNFIQKLKIIEGHPGHEEDDKNTEKGNSMNKKGDGMIEKVAETIKVAEESNKNSVNDYKETDWDKHTEESEKRDKKISTLNNISS